MALKAGYIGVKKSMLGLINKLATSKLIKTVGDGLTLTSAGTLKANIDTETMEIVNHKLSSKAGMTVDVIFSQDPGNCPDTITLTAPYTDYKLIVFAVFDTEAADKNYGYGKNVFPTAFLEQIRVDGLGAGKGAGIRLVGWEDLADYCGYEITSTTVFTKTLSNRIPGLTKVYGIK